MSQRHLQFQDRVNLGSYYAPPEIVNLAWQMINPHLDPRTTIIDTACGYGDFLKNHRQSIGCDIDRTAISIAKKNNDKAQFFQANALYNVSREKFGISPQSKLIVVGNPPYNDKTSLIRRKIKSESFDIDEDLTSRDIGISFLRSYDKLQADLVCVLHPLSYLIKPTNFKSLKGFAANYKLVAGQLISSSTFRESAKLTPSQSLLPFTNEIGEVWNMILFAPSVSMYTEAAVFVSAILITSQIILANIPTRGINRFLTIPYFSGQ